MLTHPGIIRKELERLRREDPSTQDLARLEKALAGVRERQANLGRRLALVNDDAADPVIAELNALGAQAKQLEEERQEVLRRQEGWRAAHQRLDELERWCGRIAERLDTTTFEQKQTALRALGVQVQVFQRAHSPRWIIRAEIAAQFVTSSEAGSRNAGNNSSLPPLRLRWTDLDAPVFRAE